MRLPVTILASVVVAGSACPAAAPDLEPDGGWWRSRVFYEVFVRSFADSDGDGVGDFAGLTARLDVLNDGDAATTTDLGVDALWLMPIYPSTSYHGYDVTDYQAVNPQLGTMADFEAFLAAAHRRGLKVILDFVPNHTSFQHPWFISASAGPTAALRDHYVWRAEDPQRQKWYRVSGWYYYAYFTDSMPDLNHRTEAVQEKLIQAMRFWLAKGVDGFRVDAARYLVEAGDGGFATTDLPESHAVARRWRSELGTTHPEHLLVAEAWGPTSSVVEYWGQGDEYHLAFNFALAEAMIAAARKGTPDDVANTIVTEDRLFEGKDRTFQAPFLTNHDHVRVMRQLEGDAPAARLLAATMLAQPGTPFLYYGEEIGMQGGAGAIDENKRTPMRWTSAGPGYGFSTAGPWFGAPEAAGVDVASQQADPTSLWHAYRELIAVRHAQPALSSAASRWLPAAGAGAQVFALLRGQGPSRVLFVANFSTQTAPPFTVEVEGSPAVVLDRGLAGAPARQGSAVSFGGLAPRGYAFIALQ